MSVDISRKTVAELVEEAFKLTPREQYLLTLKLTKNLKVNYTLQLSEDLEKINTTKLIEEDETYIKIDFKIQPYFSKKDKVQKYNVYGWILEWGATKRKTYIGSAYFLPKVKYRLSSKNDTVVTTLIGLGFYREKTQVFLKVLHLTPVRSIQSYLYYDESDPDYPTAPRDRFEQKWNLRTKNIECLGLVEDDPEVEQEAVQKLNDSLLKVVKEIAIKERNVELLKESQKTKVQPKTNPVQPSSTRLVKANKNLHTIHKERKVSEALEPQIIERFKQWTRLTGILSQASQWQLDDRDNILSIVDSKSIILASYDRHRRILRVDSVRALSERLKLIMEGVLLAEAIPFSYQEAAQHWLNQIEAAPSSADDILVHLFFY